jgi:ABC-2 type transport system permease protein
MKSQRFLALLKLQFKGMVRVPMALSMVLLLPLVLSLTFGLLFGSIIIEETGQSVFAFLVPGLFAISGLYMAMPVSFSFSEDRENGLLKRISITPMTSTEFIGSNIISNMSMSIIQVAIIAIICSLLGYRPVGGITGLIFAFIFMVIFSFSTIGFGLITATIAKNAKAAGGIVWIFMLPQQMLASGLYPIPAETEIISMFMPLYYASDALTLLFNGASLSNLTIWWDLIILVIFSLVIISLGIFLFKKYGKV